MCFEVSSEDKKQLHGSCAPSKLLSQGRCCPATMAVTASTAPSPYQGKACTTLEYSASLRAALLAPGGMPALKPPIWGWLPQGLCPTAPPGIPTEFPGLKANLRLHFGGLWTTPLLLTPHSNPSDPELCASHRATSRACCEPWWPQPQNGPVVALSCSGVGTVCCDAGDPEALGPTLLLFLSPRSRC